jgi:ribonuclease HII
MTDKGAKSKRVPTLLATSFQRELIEAGCDEAGRGCLAGSVFAAAVILPPDFSHPLLNDSKQMSERNRDLLREVIEREAIAWAVEEVTAERIDQINILHASFEGMTLAVKRLDPQPQFLAIDGNRFYTSLTLPFECVVKGDGKYANIAAASVLAKTHRDEYMMRLHAEYPHYGWDSNKGYPTKQHRLAIRQYGLTPYHRLSFNHDRNQLELF